MAGSLPLLNVYDVEVDGVTRQFLCFVDPVLAGSRGLEPMAIVGAYLPDPDAGEFDPDRFEPNPTFVEGLVEYMNTHAAATGAIQAEARDLSGQWLYILDPRDTSGPDADPPTTNVLGAFAVDETGQIVPHSFQYNAKHRLFDRAQGTSGLFSDRAYYDWLHGDA